MLNQRRRRRADVVQMLYKCFVFVGYVLTILDMPGAYFPLLRWEDRRIVPAHLYNVKYNT